jgi:ferrochelatase
MRYWHPFSDVCAREVHAWDPDRILLLPLYPQFSTTTTGSSLDAWRKAAVTAGIAKSVTSVCCWPADPAYVEATAARIRTAYGEARGALSDGTGLRVLFSAHGLPESIVKAGDPYQFQIALTVEAVRAALAIPGLDWSICYQSRVTPEPWLTPSTEAEIERAARDRVAVLVVPIAFVSEHSETLVELDVEYRHLAEKLEVPGYFRVPTQNDDAGFITALAGIARRALANGPGLCSHAGRRICPSAHTGCPLPLPKAA